ncbi:MAG: serine/threonine protein kinase [Lachnospira sp.]|nr:serine/threonine protein kinase [Lachnospira sp.]
MKNILTYDRKCINIVNEPQYYGEEVYLETFERRYEVIRLIAQTRHSKVYLVKHRQLEVYRIAKVVSGGSADCERALKEANTIKEFKHPGIPLVYDVEVSGDSICIIEEYIAGKSLAELIANENLTVKQIAHMGVCICEILEYLHDCVGVIHMDIKPANIMVRNKSAKKHNLIGSNHKNEYEVCLIDFDSSGYTGEVVEENFSTAEYAAPEQFSQDRQVSSARTDIYSMGMLLLYMLNGGHMQSLAESTETLCQLHSDTIGPIIRRCIRHNRIQRFKSIKELKQALSVVAKSKDDSRKQNNTCAVRDIYVYGTGHGVGTTHFSLCLAAFLHRCYRGRKVLYRRCNDREDVFAEACKGRLSEQGAYMRHGIYIMPDYGGGVDCDVSGYDIVVYDYGVERPDVDGVDESVRCICVDTCGYRKKKQAASECLGLTEVATFVNHISGKRFYELVKRAGNVRRFYRMPCIYEWNETNRLFEEAVIEALELKKAK